MKAKLDDTVIIGIRPILEFEAESHLRCGQTLDHRERVNAFMEKRQPRFVGQ